MDIQLLRSEFSKAPDLIHPVKNMFNEHRNLGEINTLADVLSLVNLKTRASDLVTQMVTSQVDLNVLKVHVQVIKPFISADEEDDFI